MKSQIKFLLVLIILVVLINLNRKYEPFTTPAEKQNYENAYRLDPTGDLANYDVSNMEISVDCCPAQYMSDTDLQSDNCEYSKKFVANNYSGMNYKDGLGCVCMTPAQANFLGQRGGNA
jgi:hypothetical protein